MPLIGTYLGHCVICDSLYTYPCLRCVLARACVFVCECVFILDSGEEGSLSFDLNSLFFESIFNSVGHHRQCSLHNRLVEVV